MLCKSEIIDKAFLNRKVYELIDRTNDLDTLYEVQKRLEHTVSEGEKMVDKVYLKWCVDVAKAELRYVNKRIEQKEKEKAAREILVETGVPYDPIADDFIDNGKIQD